MQTENAALQRQPHACERRQVLRTRVAMPLTRSGARRQEGGHSQMALSVASGDAQQALGNAPPAPCPAADGNHREQHERPAAWSVTVDYDAQRWLSMTVGLR